MYPLSSVYQAANMNRGFSFLRDSEYLWIDWERGIIQSCSQFQDHKILLHQSIVLQFLTLSHKLIHCGRLLLLLHSELLEFQLLSSVSFQPARSSKRLKLCFSCLVLRIASFLSLIRPFRRLREFHPLGLKLSVNFVKTRGVLNERAACLFLEPNIDGS